MPFSRKEFIIKSGITAGIVAMNLPSKFKLSSFINKQENKFVLLGTRGGPVVYSYKATPSANLVVYNNIPFIIDTGYGVSFKLIEAGINLKDIKYIFITHHHSDHNLELGNLLYNSWVGGLSSNINVYAPAGLISLLDAYWQSNRFDIETRVADEGRPDIRKLVIIHEYTEGVILSNADAEVSALKNIHPPVTESYALRFKFRDKTIVFSGDTTYCPALAAFALNADYLVHEVLYGPGIDPQVKRRLNSPKLKESILSHHTLAEDVGRIAAQAKAKTLVLNHFIPADDESITDEMWLKAVRTNFSGNIIVGKDLLQLPL
jgi:ribonuclease BN (tRNA processing enzyme)